jgi:hypothetical protein
MREEIRNPSGVVINKNQFNSSSRSEDNDGDDNEAMELRY